VLSGPIQDACPRHHHAQPELETRLVQRLDRRCQYPQAKQALPGLLLHHVPEHEMGDGPGGSSSIECRPACSPQRLDSPGIRDALPQLHCQGRGDQLGGVPVGQQDAAQVCGPFAKRSLESGTCDFGLSSQDLVGDPGQQGLLVGVVPVDGGRLDTQRLADAAHRKVGQPIGIQDVQGSGDDGLPAYDHVLTIPVARAYSWGELLDLRLAEEGDGMTRYQQANRLQGVHYDVRGRNMVEAQRMVAAGQRVLHLNIGNLAPFGFAAPESMVRSVVANMAESEGYADARGIYTARTAVANYYQTFGLEVDIEQVMIGNGVSELISMVLQAMLNIGDEILIPAPDYPLWTAQTNLSSGRAVHYLCDESNSWQPDIDDIRSKITPRTKALVIINPNNPTGAVYSTELLQQLIDLAREFNLIVLSDEIYEKVVYSGSHVHAAALASHDVLCFTFSGLSKAYRACGWRAGWLVVTGPLDAAGNLLEGLDLLANMRMCANVPAQHAIQTALGGYQSIDDLVKPGGRFHDQLDLAHKLLNKIPGISCEPARGALYLFPRLNTEMFDIEDDEDWALGLLRSKKILVSHGRGFNWPHPDHFRLVALPEEAVLREAIGRIAEYCEETTIR
jgi:alanine-synthesizing transaminase